MGPLCVLDLAHCAQSAKATFTSTSGQSLVLGENCLTAETCIHHLHTGWTADKCRPYKCRYAIPQSASMHANSNLSTIYSHTTVTHTTVTQMTVSHAAQLCNSLGYPAWNYRRREVRNKCTQLHHRICTTDAHTRRMASSGICC